jgi:hypothetical protein
MKGGVVAGMSQILSTQRRQAGRPHQPSASSSPLNIWSRRWRIQQFGVVPVDAGDFFLDGVAEKIVAVGRQRVHFDEERIGQLDGNGFRHAGEAAVLWRFGNGLIEAKAEG